MPSIFSCYYRLLTAVLPTDAVRNVYIHFVTFIFNLLFPCGSGSQHVSASLFHTISMSDLSVTPSPDFLAESIGLQITATASIMIILCTIFVGMRYYARYLTSTPFTVEDVILPFAWLAEVGLYVVGISKQNRLNLTPTSSLTPVQPWSRKPEQVAIWPT